MEGEGSRVVTYVYVAKSVSELRRDLHKFKGGDHALYACNIAR